MIAFVINLIFSGVFFYIGIKAIREKKISYRRKSMFKPNENITWIGKKAVALGWLYVVMGAFFLASPFFKFIFAPRVVY